jgi:hypothetical protein
LAILEGFGYSSNRTVLLHHMEPVTILLGLAAIVGTGALSKVGENITDKGTEVAINLYHFLKRKLPNSSTLKSIEAGETINYGKAYLELKPVADDAEAIPLFTAVKAEVEANPELAKKVEAELNGQQLQLSTAIENWTGINFKNSSPTFIGPITIK